MIKMPAITKANVRKMLDDEEFHQLNELIELPEDKVVPILTDLMSKDTDPLIRQRCAIALGMIGNPQSASALSNRLDDESMPVVISAVRALGQLKDTGSVKQVTRLLRSGDPSVRRSAAQALGVIAVPESEKPLTDLLDAEPEEFVRESAAQALRELHRRASDSG
jgi:HEAT repeat protein